MRKQYVPIITLVLAVVLVGSIAYAADKKKKARLVADEPQELSEEALRVELLAATEGQQKTVPATKASRSKKSHDVLAGTVKATKQDQAVTETLQ